MIINLAFSKKGLDMLAENIRYIRKELGLTQAGLAAKLGLKRPVIGAYEEGRAEPRIHTLQLIAELFGVSLDQLVRTDLQTGYAGADASGKSLRVLPIAIDAHTEQERASLVPVKAAAGYLAGYGDMDYIGTLSHFALPFPELPSDRTYRVFQIQGDSMLPIPSGAYVVCEYVQDWSQLKPDTRYILLTRDEGVVFKRVKHLPSGRQYELVSDNAAYEPYRIDREQVLEVWKSRAVIHFDLDAFAASAGDMKDVLAAIQRLEKAVSKKGN